MPILIKAHQPMVAFMLFTAYAQKAFQANIAQVRYNEGNNYSQCTRKIFKVTIEGLRVRFS